jgi:alkanesulfonate monooxygenase SsuD/methylene tetrahydromethanopterin reductase-like flavin-dependent oxidoreductase (luciferase family)
MGAFFGSNRFKFGMFGLNCAGGMTLSSATERWAADWDEIAAVSKMADDEGIEFLLPIAKWHGLGGDADMWGRSFETFTQAAALGAITKRIGLFVTAHVSLITAAFAAKAITTLDDVSHGRAGINIVCGWNPDEFNMHGITIDPDLRYAKGLEWFRIYEKLLKGGPEFDWDGEYYKLKGLVTYPLPLQKPGPPVMSAAQSGDGQALRRRRRTFSSPPCTASSRSATWCSVYRGLLRSMGAARMSMWRPRSSAARPARRRRNMLTIMRWSTPIRARSIISAA